MDILSSQLFLRSREIEQHAGHFPCKWPTTVWFPWVMNSCRYARMHLCPHQEWFPRTEPNVSTEYSWVWTKNEKEKKTLKKTYSEVSLQSPQWIPGILQRWYSWLMVCLCAHEAKLANSFLKTNLIFTLTYIIPVKMYSHRNKEM